jgi:hypothetical protein
MRMAVDDRQHVGPIFEHVLEQVHVGGGLLVKKSPVMKRKRSTGPKA